jgi:cell division protease FtsH
VAQEDFAEAIEPVVAGLDKKSRVLNDKENPLSLKLTQSVP